MRKKFRSVAFDRCQKAPYLVHSPRDRSLGHTEDCTRFRVRQLLARHKNRRVAKRRLQLRNGALQPDGVVEVATVRGGCCNADEYRQLLRECAERAAPAPPVTAGVERNSAEPGAELGLTTEASDLLDQSAADVLSDVIGVRAGPGQLPG